MSRRTFLPLSLVAVLGSLAFACSAPDKNAGPGSDSLGNDGGVDDGGIQLGDGATPVDVGVFNGVSITPSNAVVTIDLTATPAKPGVQKYTVKVHHDDGTDSDVSDVAVMNIDSKYGTFDKSTFTSVNALPDGKPQVAVFTATVADADGKTKTAQAQLTLIALRKTGDKRDFFFVVPYQQDPSPSKDVLKFNTNIKQVDVAFLMDTTGSMGGVISGLKTSLSTTIIPTLKKTIPSVGVAVAGHDDFPVSPFGSADIDQPFYLLQTVTTSVTAAQAGVNALATHGGNDGPEAQYEGVYQILTGDGVKWTTGQIKKKTNAPMTYGFVDFRAGSLPVVVLMTDANFHSKEDYEGKGTAGGSNIFNGTPEPHGFDEVKAAYEKTHARHVGISTTTSKGPVGSYTSFPQNSELSQISGSYVSPKVFKGKCGTGMCCTDAGGVARSPDGPGGTCLLNFMSSISGSDISSSIVDAIAALSAGSNFDVTATWSRDPANMDVDTSQFIKGLRAMKEGDVSQGCPASDTKDTDGDGVDDTFLGVTVGIPVCFEVIPAKNTIVPPTKEPQFFNAYIDVLGMPGSVKLDQRTVLFLVPPTDIIAK
ncbi:MAG: hypothetical protein ACXVEE_25900 [Polyangiales bacterium]